jgi:hypothetical protein
MILAIVGFRPSTMSSSEVYSALSELQSCALEKVT